MAQIDDRSPRTLRAGGQSAGAANAVAEGRSAADFHRSDKTFAAVAAVTIFLSAFLLFQVQPIIGKAVLPWFGGSPAVWTTCMLFFQVLLVAGYAYAHGLISIRQFARQGLLHLALIVVALAMLPILPADRWVPIDGTLPTVKILALLAVHVGLPYFVLCGTGPLVQSWFARRLPGRSPYRLFALSNAGSLAALLSYPFLVEPLLGLEAQAAVWSTGFALYALALAAAAWLRQSKPADAAEPAAAATGSLPELDLKRLAEPPLRVQLRWVLQAALASLMLLAITNHLCQNVAVIPLFWVIPLSIYLLSFIICFDHDRWYARRTFAVGTIAVLAVESLMRLGDGENGWAEQLWIPAVFTGEGFGNTWITEAVLYLVVLTAACMVCHGELARSRPASEHLTAFYLMIAVGGAAGGMFVGVLCPIIFSTFAELRIGIVACYFLAVSVVLSAAGPVRGIGSRFQRLAIGGALAAGLAAVFAAQLRPEVGGAVSFRNFYGVVQVEKVIDDSGRMTVDLHNGIILHGSQFVAPHLRHVPTTYYGPRSGMGRAISHYQTEEPLRVGVVGLGCGTTAAYARPGDEYHFYEIDPLIELIAWRHFSFLSDAIRNDAAIEFHSGDARLTLSHQPPQDFSVLVIDAFSGDAIPVHLLTHEAFAVYLRHVTDGGTIAVHISNRHLDLEPVVLGAAKRFGLSAVTVDSSANTSTAEQASRWMLLTRNRELMDESIATGWARVAERSVVDWTDRYSNLFAIMMQPRAIRRSADEGAP